MPEEQTPAAAPETTPDPIVATPSTSADNDGLSFFDALDKAIEESEKPKETPPAEDKPKEDATAPDDKPKEKADEDDAAETKNMTPTAGAKFKEIKAEAKAARARVAELEAKLAEVEKAPKPDVEAAEKLQAAIAEKEAKLSEYEKELAIVRFEATPEYKETVIQPMAAILGVVERLAKKYEVPEKKLISILEEADPDAQGDQISEIASGFSERDRVSLYALGDDYSAVLAQREELRSKAAVALEAREKQAAAAAAAAAEKSKKEWDSTTSKVWDTMKAKVPLPEDPSLEASIVSQVKSANFDTLAPDLKAFAAFSGALVPVVVKQYKALEAKVAELQEALDKYQKATPSSAAGGDLGTSSLEEGLGFLDAIERRFSGV